MRSGQLTRPYIYILRRNRDLDRTSQAEDFNKSSRYDVKTLPWIDEPHTTANIFLVQRPTHK
jgi:hypothetical protein